MYIADSSLTPRHFYNGILSQLGVEGKFYRGDSKRILQRELEILTVLQHITPVIIVDEAHLLEREMLEELRFMLNVAVDSQSPMSLILCPRSTAGSRSWLPDSLPPSLWLIPRWSCWGAA